MLASVLLSESIQISKTSIWFLLQTHRCHLLTGPVDFARVKECTHFKQICFAAKCKPNDLGKWRADKREKKHICSLAL